MMPMRLIGSQDGAQGGTLVSSLEQRGDKEGNLSSSMHQIFCSFASLYHMINSVEYSQ